jgi:hypothetical protein
LRQRVADVCHPRGKIACALMTRPRMTLQEKV